MFRLSRRAALLAAAPAALAAPAAVAAEWRPSRPLQIVVPFAAGSGTDAVARLVAQLLSQELGGAAVTVENRPGGNGTLAALAVARAAPDGHTLLAATNTTHAANPWLLRRMEYDPVADFAPVGRLGNYVFWLALGPEVPARTLAEFVALARSRPGQLSYASGNGTGIVAGAAVAKLAGLDMLHVPYRSTPPAMTDVIAGRVTGMVVDITASAGFVREGRLRPLGVTSARRSALAPDVPSLAEQGHGLDGFDLLSWAALYAPARTDPVAHAAVAAAFARASARPEYRQRLADMGFEGIPSSPSELADFTRAQIAEWGRMIRLAGIEPE